MDAVSQQVEFVWRTLPALFHQTPEQFLVFLERDGNSFLRFYWDEAGKGANILRSKSAFGLNYNLYNVTPRVGVALIQLPAPAGPPEAFFTALCYRPDRVGFLGIVTDTTKVLALEMADEESRPPGILLVEHTRKGVRDVLGPGPEPSSEVFYQVVLEQLGD